MSDQKVGNLMETVVPKQWDGQEVVGGDEVPIHQGKNLLGRGRIIWIIATGGALMKVIVEIVQWYGK